MVTDLVRTTTPEEREYARLLGEVERLKGVVADLQQELAELTSEIAEFEANYHATIGPLYLEIDRVKAAIRQYELLIARLHEHSDIDPEVIESDVSEAMQQAWERLRKQQEEVREWEELRKSQSCRPDLTGDEHADLMSIYRELARRHHPDLSRSENEAAWREPMMRRINEAFERRDLKTLKALLLETAPLDSSFEERSIGEKLVWAIREISRLGELKESLHREISTLETSETAKLMGDGTRGTVMLDRLTQALQNDLAGLDTQLATLIASWLRKSNADVRV